MMLLIRDLTTDLNQLPSKPMVLAVGNFDGLHLGHQAVIGRAVHIARQRGCLAAALTFRQHPRSILYPENPPEMLLPPEEKIRQIQQLGVELLVFLDFTKELAEMSAEEFIGHVLCEELHIAQIVVGENFGFGKGRRGCPAMLKEQGGSLGFQVTVIPSVRIGDQVVSSTLIRRLLLEGQVRQAGVLLNREYEIVAEVIRGDERGRQMGFPTANLKIDKQLVPFDGVYAAWVVCEGKRYAGMVNIGQRPTFAGASKSVEIHLIDFTGDLYGQSLSVHFVERIRDERLFPSHEELKKELVEDRRRVLDILQQRSSSQVACRDRLDGLETL